MADELNGSTAGMFDLNKEAEERFGKDCLDLAMIYTSKRHADLQFNLSHFYSSRGQMNSRMLKGCTEVLLREGLINMNSRG